MTAIKMRSAFVTAAVVMLFVVIVPVLAGTPIWEDFNSQPNPTAVEFINVPGAALASSQGAGDWITSAILPDLFANMDGTVAQQRRCDSTLNITLNDDYNRIRFAFAYGSPTSNITVSLWDDVPGAGGSFVASQVFLGTQNGGFANWYEGDAFLEAQSTFNYVIVANRDGCAALDNLYME